MNHKKYTHYYFLLLTVSFLLIMLFNLLLRSYHSNRPLMIILKKPSSLIIGTSTTNFGLNPDHNSIVNQNYYNISVGGIKNKLLWIKKMNSIKKLDNIILGLDFFEFNYFRKEKVDEEINYIDNKTLIIKKLLKELLSIDSLLYSLKKLFGFANEVILSNGHASQNDFTLITSFQEMPLNELKTFLPLPNKEFSIYGDDILSSKLHYLKQIITYCADQKINLIMILPPRHISLTKMERHLNINTSLEQWKSEVVELVIDTKKYYHQSLRFQLWDFALVNDFSAENLPNDGKNMKWFRDRIHFKEAYGNMILDMVFKNKDISFFPENFGKRIDNYNIEEHLKNNNYYYEINNKKLNTLFDIIETNINRSVYLYKN